MTSGNVEMWKELGIDLKSHDILMTALGPMFKEIYLDQRNRPVGMGFYDFVVGDIHGIGPPALSRSAFAPERSSPSPPPNPFCPAIPAP